ncbi:MAG: MBL fold metallo-hydrolase [Candidatus Reconcilbacillus cellulovorans]|uniref:MBL fold metallo-hydrolase n=1 Tax=Candidatus Reconcilbacillus cellulovorans TaxID=1906605 RepID=A0A2A6E4A5_9BACL|nr:MAG: MBL fold metallo-hydrolase [Candidatus Reconcilbacillus cellulovorans]
MAKSFRNMSDVRMEKTLGDFVRWQRERLSKRKDLSFAVPRAESVDTNYLRANRSEPAIVWIGHSSFLIQLGGLHVVTDPVWANRMGFGRRLAPPGLLPSDLPAVDVALISHSHYDHLHIRSLRQLPGDPEILVPEGLGAYLSRKGFRRVRELGWWQSVRIGSVEFAFVPAQHWTRRTLWDMNKSHWGGWVMTPVGRNAGMPTVYFAGDSGYFPGFRQIGEKFSIDCALMPIGAYEPEWFMGPQHVTPEEAVQAFLDVGARWFVPMHYGAFRLADDTPKEALDRLHAAWKARGLEADRLRVLKLGEIWKVPIAEQMTGGAASGDRPPVLQPATSSHG